MVQKNVGSKKFGVQNKLVWVNSENIRYQTSYSGGKKKKTHKIVILDPKNRDSLVAKKISNTRSLLVTLYF